MSFANEKIRKEDKTYCERHQQAFDQAGKALAALLECSQAAAAQQNKLLRLEPGYVQHLYLGRDIASGEIIRKAVKDRSYLFIEQITKYFTREYCVPINMGAIASNLLPTPPNAEDGFLHWSAEKTEEKENAYLKALLELPLHYEAVTVEIFKQMKEGSFAETALAEQKERCWYASHHPGNGTEWFQLKGDTLRLTGYFCECMGDWNPPRWRLSERTNTILDGIAHYETQSFARGNRGSDLFPAVYGFQIEDNAFEFPASKCISSIKLFKNGRVDIRFRDSACLQEFATQYLREEPN